MGNRTSNEVPNTEGSLAGPSHLVDEDHRVSRFRKVRLFTTRHNIIQINESTESTWQPETAGDLERKVGDLLICVINSYS